MNTSSDGNNCRLNLSFWYRPWISSSSPSWKRLLRYAYTDAERSTSWRSNPGNSRDTMSGQNLDRETPREETGTALLAVPVGYRSSHSEPAISTTSENNKKSYSNQIEPGLAGATVITSPATILPDYNPSRPSKRTRFDMAL